MADSGMLDNLFSSQGASMTAYGSGESAATVVETFGAYEAEYAALRKGVGVMDCPQRAVIELTGADHLDFLHRMLSQDLKTPPPGRGARAFLLNRQGRILADLLVLHAVDRTLLIDDIFSAVDTTKHLDDLLFGEDVQITNQTGRLHQLSLHGPGAAATLQELISAAQAVELAPWEHSAMTIAGHTVTAYRRDEVGSPGVHLLIPSDDVETVYQAVLQAIGFDWSDVQDADIVAKRRGRPTGWLAYNTARIEAGLPIYRIDFGPDSLPHETGAVDEAVSFTKGCYTGQEIVARIQSRGHPKKVLVGLKLADDRQPIGGSEIFENVDDRPGDIVGAVTSSTVSPMLGGKAIALAMVQWDQHEPGKSLLVAAERALVVAQTHTLRFI